MTEEKKYVILRLTKDDIRNTIENDGNEKELLEKIDALDDTQMKYLANKLGELYCEDDYWETLRNLFLDMRWNK